MPRLAMKLYVIFDVIAETLVGSVMLAPNDGAASRAFARAVLDPQQLGANPKDYRLLFVGEISDFGDVTGADPSIVVTGAEVLERAKGEQS